MEVNMGAILSGHGSFDTSRPPFVHVLEPPSPKSIGEDDDGIHTASPTAHPLGSRADYYSRRHILFRRFKEGGVRTYLFDNGSRDNHGIADDDNEAEDFAVFCASAPCTPATTVTDPDASINSSMEDECRQAVASAMKALKSTAVSGSNTPLSTTVHFHVQMGERLRDDVQILEKDRPQLHCKKPDLFAKGSMQCKYCNNMLNLRFVNMLTFPRPVQKFRMLLSNSMKVHSLHKMVTEEYGAGEDSSLVLLWRGKPIQRDKDKMTLKTLGMKSNQIVAISRQLGRKPLTDMVLEAKKLAGEILSGANKTISHECSSVIFSHSYFHGYQIIASCLEILCICRIFWAWHAEMRARISQAELLDLLDKESLKGEGKERNNKQKTKKKREKDRKRREVMAARKHQQEQQQLQQRNVEKQQQQQQQSQATHDQHLETKKQTKVESTTKKARDGQEDNIRKLTHQDNEVEKRELKKKELMKEKVKDSSCHPSSLQAGTAGAAITTSSACKRDEDVTNHFQEVADFFLENKLLQDRRRHTTHNGEEDEWDKEPMMKRVMPLKSNVSVSSEKILNLVNPTELNNHYGYEQQCQQYSFCDPSNPPPTIEEEQQCNELQGSSFSENIMVSAHLNDAGAGGVRTNADSQCHGSITTTATNYFCMVCGSIVSNLATPCTFCGECIIMPRKTRSETNDGKLDSSTTVPPCIPAPARNSTIIAVDPAPSIIMSPPNDDCPIGLGSPPHEHRFPSVSEEIVPPPSCLLSSTVHELNNGQSPIQHGRLMDEQQQRQLNPSSGGDNINNNGVPSIPPTQLQHHFPSPDNILHSTSLHQQQPVGQTSFDRKNANVSSESTSAAVRPRFYSSAFVDFDYMASSLVSSNPSQLARANVGVPRIVQQHSLPPPLDSGCMDSCHQNQLLTTTTTTTKIYGSSAMNSDVYSNCCGSIEQSGEDHHQYCGENHYDIFSAPLPRPPGLESSSTSYGGDMAMMRSDPLCSERHKEELLQFMAPHGGITPLISSLERAVPSSEIWGTTTKLGRSATNEEKEISGYNGDDWECG